MAASAKSAAGKAAPKKSSKARSPSEGSRSATTKARPVLNDRHQRFVIEYLVDYNATKAYLRAGYCTSLEAARRNAARLLTRDDISTEVERQSKAMLNRVQQSTEVTLERTVREIAKLAFVDPRKFFHPDGRPKNITELDDETASALAGMDVQEEFEGSGEDRKFVGFTKKYKLADKNASLDKLMRHLGGYKADNDQNKQENPLAQLLGMIHGAGSTLPLKS